MGFYRQEDWSGSPFPSPHSHYTHICIHIDIYVHLCTCIHGLVRCSVNQLIEPDTQMSFDTLHLRSPPYLLAACESALGQLTKVCLVLRTLLLSTRMSLNLRIQSLFQSLHLKATIYQVGKKFRLFHKMLRRNLSERFSPNQ